MRVRKSCRFSSHTKPSQKRWQQAEIRTLKMKEYGIKTLYGILGIGIIISIFHIANDSGGSALENTIKTLGITSLVLFLSTIILLVFTFKENIRKTKIWILLIISFPLSFQIITNLTNEYYLKIIETSTPKEFIYNSEVNFETYKKDKLKIERLIDSLLEVKIIEKPSELALRYFNGKTYNDSIERDWAIDLPLSLKYEKSIIDTLFYSKNGEKIVAGLMIYKVYNKYRNQMKGGIEFRGRGFVYNENKEKPVANTG